MVSRLRGGVTTLGDAAVEDMMGWRLPPPHHADARRSLSVANWMLRSLDRLAPSEVSAMYTVGTYLAARLSQIGLKHHFAVAGDL
jgi:hypothetical protein